MPSIEMMERDRVAYVENMKNYLKNLQCMEKSKAKEVSRANLVRCEILQENGEFAEYYQHIEITVQVHKKRN